MTRGYNPAFDLDLPYGAAGEELARSVLGWVLNGHARVEVKRKRRVDGLLYVELMQDPGGTGTRWRQSGLNTTEADLWAYVVADTGVLIVLPTDLLRWAVRTDAGRPCAETDGDNPTQGRLFHIAWLMQAASTWKAAA